MPCFWTTSFDSFFVASAAVSLSRLMSPYSRDSSIPT